MGIRLGIFGGSFDPPHRAHAMVILWALQSGEIDRVVVVPAGVHAFGKKAAAGFPHRFRMCELMVREFDANLIEVSDIEGRREGISYMVDTARELLVQNPGDSFRLIAGSDVADDLNKWHKSDELLRIAPPLIVPRIVENNITTGALPALSSTEVRGLLVRQHEKARPFLSAAVLNYINQHSLYRKDA